MLRWFTLPDAALRHNKSAEAKAGFPFQLQLLDFI
jgi:hypothetical protein